ncbi:hypothetical protein SAMN06265222_105181 [Neorhodopirellula lusitana]|uniref:Uncharacterized protein n=1 Tax=Neorhodopirellula lusitana TaxID=445327 RepID=A0ABY1Q311_9BACT|nr:hypothetical protein [Neorhodopirellula lusitana]SMP56644.1 hypothetical protein SAMN06265222_105181 [Neorhodopirellula lusitana]
MPAHSRRRNLLAVLAAAVVSSSVGASSASACCLTDWMYGRQPAYAATPPVPITTGTPYAAGYGGYSAGYTPYTASYTPYTAGYTPLLTGTSTSSTLPLAGTSVYSTPPAYSVQRPAYGAVPLNNPSVYTGMPVTSGYRGAATTSNPFYGTGNVYPNNYAAAAPAVTAMRPATAPVVSGYRTPVRSGLARFFDSLLGTGYRTSYYNAPITYYRPATSVDPVTGTTVTVQQPCASSVQQIQRTPYATFDPMTGGAPTSGVAPCGATGCGNDLYGATPIPSTSYPSTTMPSTIDSYGAGGGVTYGGGVGGSDYQPLSPPTLPSQSFSGSAPTVSGRPDLTVPFPQSNFQSSSAYESGYPDSAYSGSVYSDSTYSDSTFSGPVSNLSPLTGDSNRVASPSDRVPLEAPELRSARPASPDVDPNEVYRKGYEAGRAAMEEQQRKSARYPDSQDRYDSDRDDSDRYDAERYDTRSNDVNGRDADSNGSASDDSNRDQTERPPVRSHYQLDPPSNGRSSTPSWPSTDDRETSEDSLQRSRYEIERDQRDLRELTTGVQPNRDADRSNGQPAWHRVRPIPAPDNYRNPFDSTTQTALRETTGSVTPPSYRNDVSRKSIQAPDLLPALPSPESTFQRQSYDQPSRWSPTTGQRLSVPVREASMQETSYRGSSRDVQSSAAPVREQTKANAWKDQVRQQTQESGWYSKDR